jgi:hypothetical protein
VLKTTPSSLVAREIERAQALGEVNPDANVMNTAVLFLLGLYALLVTTHDWPRHKTQCSRIT